MTPEKLSSLVAAAAEALDRIIRRNAGEHFVDDSKVIVERRSHPHRPEDDEGHHWRRLRHALYLANGEHPLQKEDIFAPTEGYEAANKQHDLVLAGKRRTTPSGKQKKSTRIKHKVHTLKGKLRP